MEYKPPPKCVNETVIMNGVKCRTSAEPTALARICILQGLINNLEKGVVLPNESVLF